MPLGLSSWSTAYTQPPGGLGSDAAVHVIRKMRSAGNQSSLIVAGNFGQVGGLSVPWFAKYRFEGGQVQGSWQWPWGTQPSVPASGSYLAAHESAAGNVAIGGSTPIPFLYYNGSSWTFDSPISAQGNSDPVIHAIEHWSVNDRFLVVGDFGYPGGGDAPGAFNCLAQWNPALPLPPRFDSFGYPDTGANVNWWLNTSLGYKALAVTEIERPGGAFDGFLLVGGDFQWINKYDPPSSGTFTSPNVFVFDDGGGFHESELPGPVLDFELRPIKTHLYAAGEFGKASPDKEYDPVWQMSLADEGVIDWGPLSGGGGPYTFGATSWAVIHELAFQNGYLYAIGDFDRVLTKRPGGFPQFADGFARYSMRDEVWESLANPSSIDGPLLAGERTYGAVLVGGGFLHVDGSVESYHVAQFNPADVVAAPDMAAVGTEVPLAMQVVSENPTRGPLAVYYELPRRALVRMAIYDVAGRHVAQIIDAEQDAGEQSVRWNGRSSTGQMILPGVYFVRLSAGGVQVATKVTVIR